MRRKKYRTLIIILCVLVALLVGVGVYVAFGDIDAILSLFGYTETLTETVNVSSDAENVDFSFLSTESTAMSDNMKGFFLDPYEDIDLAQSESELKSELEYIIDVTETLEIDTLFVSLYTETEYTNDTFDWLEYLITYAGESDVSVILCYNTSLAEENEDAIFEIIENYSPCAVCLLDIFEYFGDASSAASFLTSFRADVNSLGVTLGALVAYSYAVSSDTSEEYVSLGVADWYILDMYVSTQNGTIFQDIVEDWSSLCETYDMSIYACLHNELVYTGDTWNTVEEMRYQLRAVNNYGCFSGVAFASYYDLAENTNESTVTVYAYWKVFNDYDYTYLEVSGFDVSSDGESITISGTGDTTYPLFVRNKATGTWDSIELSDSGEFSVEIRLATGENEIVIHHANATYVFSVIKAADIITSTSVECADDLMSVTLSCTAVAGSDVYAYINGEYISLSAASTDGETTTYSAVYEFSTKTQVSETSVSFYAVINGISAQSDGGVESETIYNDNGNGTQDIVLVTFDMAETNSADEDDDLSDPTYTPQTAGSISEFTGITVYENTVLYETASGIQLSAFSASLVLGAYAVSDTTATLSSVTVGETTDIVISQSNPSFTRVTLNPQEYYTGYLERAFNVYSCEAEYVDITLYGVTSADGTCTFSDDSIFESCEWLTDTDNDSVTLRLYLRETGGIYGYDLTRDSDGNLCFSFKHKQSTLSGAVIVIDAGHGGYGDSGTYSSDGSIYECTITLNIALYLKEILEENGATVILTRDDDTGMTVNDRLKFSRLTNADIFVSIHCDGSTDSSAYGVHTFYYNSFSYSLAENIQEQLVSLYRNYLYTDSSSSAYTNLDLGTNFYPFAVTRAENCPSVLVECGYLTNSTDQTLLENETMQYNLAVAIAQGIVNTLEGD